MNLFDLNLGPDFLSQIPTSPGIYKIYDKDSSLIYIGKAKNLKRRLSQYKNAKRRKKHRKMKKIIKNAARIQFEVCESEQAAEILETQLIQIHRPKWNIVGAFYFLYPLIGMKRENEIDYFCYTTVPHHFRDFKFYGAFRSREITGEAFFSLMKLLRFVGHPATTSRVSSLKIPKYSYVYAFRQLPKEWQIDWDRFFKGRPSEALENLILALVENAGARQNGEDIQACLNQLARFRKHEAIPLAQVLLRLNHTAYPVEQLERDLLFLKSKHSEGGTLIDFG